MTVRPALYWVATSLFCFGMGASGVADLLHVEGAQEIFAHLGYPPYLLTILGVAKPLGALVVFAPRLRRLKEWAYAGLMIDLVGASASHAFVHDGPFDVLLPWIFIAIGMTSYALRPASRRL